MFQSLHYSKCVKGKFVTKQAAKTTALQMKTSSLIGSINYLEAKLKNRRTRF